MGNSKGRSLSDSSIRFAKNTIEHHSDDLSYGVSHMKGSPSSKQDGDSIWKMPLFTCTTSPEEATTSSASSTDTEVPQTEIRSRSSPVRGKTLSNAIGSQSSNSNWQLRTGFDRHFPSHGRSAQKQHWKTVTPLYHSP